MALMNMILFPGNFARQMESLDLIIFENCLQDIIIFAWKVFDLGQSSTAEIKGENQWAFGLNKG